MDADGIGRGAYALLELAAVIQNAVPEDELRTQFIADGLEDFFSRLESGDRGFAKVWRDYVSDLAVAVTNLRMAYDCDVMLGGYVGAFAESHRAEIEGAMAGVDMFEDDFSFLRIARHGFESSAIGAAIRLRDEAVELL